MLDLIDNSMLRFAGIQMLVCKDKLTNLQKAAELVNKAVLGGAKLVSLPECFNCPYGNEFFAEYAEKVPGGQTFERLRSIASENKIYLVGGSIPEVCDDGNLYNTSLVFNPNGEMIAKQRKVHLFDIDIPGKIRFQESETLSPGSDITVFDVEDFKVGLAICYDLRFGEMAHIMRLKGAHFMIYPGAFNMTTGPIYFELLTRARAVDNQVYCASVAPATDTSSKYVSWGHSLISSPTGHVVDSAEDSEKIIYCDLKMEDIQSVRDGIPTWKQKRGDLYDVVQKS